MSELTVEEIAASGLRGRGGADFPVARKMQAVRDAVARTGRPPVVVVNGSESEPASRKDEVLLAFRPHLVLDGAAAAARLLGADEVVVHVHSASAAAQRLSAALDERAAARLLDPGWRLSRGPGSYTSGESTAVIQFLEGGPARPRSNRLPVAVRGLHDAPTLLHNAETFAQLALLARAGRAAWRRDGPPDGSFLVTLDGDVREPGRVVEVAGTATLGELLNGPGGVSGGAAVLIGGFAGRWLDARRVSDLPLGRTAMAEAGVPLGCGLVAVLPPDACGVAQTAGLVRWLAGQSAGQCGPCVFGLPSLAELIERLARGRPRRRDDVELRRLSSSIVARGACRHPDGVLALVASMLEVFLVDVTRHAAGTPCRKVHATPWLRLPDEVRGVA
ncbi:MAG TPA: NADH-ubiquinone oxidoreductase-F iron-sulfur binding region domain-containing protein [Frankiaceae bacterium]|nr:NADH-ubiquinone oxidoreductase-F iron-sulfur binding region domain-containing protein [Frankiaceae bacterium]